MLSVICNTQPRDALRQYSKQNANANNCYLYYILYIYYNINILVLIHANAIAQEWRRRNGERSHSRMQQRRLSENEK
jgi:hypothetical protein